MKKILILAGVFILLAGCSTASKDTVVTECTYNKVMSPYTTVVQNYESTGDRVLSIEFKGQIIAPSKEQMTQFLEQVQVNLDRLNALDGVSSKIVRVDDIEANETTVYNLKEASLNELVSLGIIQKEESAKEIVAVSLKQSIEGLEENGFECKTK